MTNSNSRRQVLSGLTGFAALAVAGCGEPTRGEAAERRGSTPERSNDNQQAATITMYRDPGCGCCEEWAERARSAGYRVVVTDSADMPAIKRKLGVPAELASCHTAIVGAYVVEGHVPLEAVRRLIETRPAGTKGIAVPGMPRGSPGMEMPDGTADAFVVMAFDDAGRISVFA